MCWSTPLYRDLVSTEEPAIDPQSATPVYRQLADIIAAQITAGVLLPDRPIPAETRMAEEYGVARLTARRAVAELRDRGLVITVQGKGTYVLAAPPPAEDD